MNINTFCGRTGLPSLAILCLAAAVDQTGPFRQKYAIAGTLEVTSAEVDDQSPGDGPVRVAMRCRLDRPGAYAFQFDPVRPSGHAEVLTVVSPAPRPSPHQSILPGGIDGGPPRVLPDGRAPTVTCDANDPDAVTIRWSYGDSAGRDAAYGMKLSACTFSEGAAAATQPTTRPVG